MTIAVLEAGDEETKYQNTEVPVTYFELQNTEADWAYRTVPQDKACRGMVDRVRFAFSI